jgi:hypothetical protein
MARRIRLDQIGDYAEDKLNQLMRVVVFETDAELKARSPVDTGRFRASWAIGENQTGNYDAGPSTSTAPVALNYTLGNEKIGNVYNIHNSLPYAEPLANGSSKQAPAGWVDLVAKQMTRRARQLANSIGRQD